MLVWLDPSESCGERRKQCSLTPLDVPSTPFSVVNPYRLKLVLLILIVFFKIPDSQMTELEIGSPIWDDVPQERPVWDDQGSNESSNTGHRSRRISSIQLGAWPITASTPFSSRTSDLWNAPEACGADRNDEDHESWGFASDAGILCLWAVCVGTAWWMWAWPFFQESD